MEYSRVFDYIADERARIRTPHPSHLIVISKIKDAFDDVAGMAFRMDSFWIDIPKERLSKANFWLFLKLFCAFHISFNYTKKYFFYPSVW